MAGMKRFITYIYAYEMAQKAGNTGFAKVELRGEDCRLEIHLRNVYAAQTVCKAYLFREKNGDMEGSLIGEMTVRNGTGDFVISMKTAHIPQSGLDFFEMHGIFVCSEDGRIFMSRWTEGNPLTVDMAHFREWGRQLEEKQSQCDILEEVKEPISANEEAGCTQEEEIKEKLECPDCDEIAATEIPARNFFPTYQWNEIWEQLLKNHPEHVPFSENHVTCMKIELKEIRELPRQYWYLGNNSFLLHGFFNYHYLILGKMDETPQGSEEEETRWFMGVPGIYQNQERVMAIIFGFPEFMPEQVENRFGCWYRFLE